MDKGTGGATLDGHSWALKNARSVHARSFSELSYGGKRLWDSVYGEDPYTQKGRITPHLGHLDGVTYRLLRRYALPGRTGPTVTGGMKH